MTRRGEGRENVLLIRLSDYERKLLKEAATQAGLPLGTWLRELGMQMVRKDTGVRQ